MSKKHTRKLSMTVMSARPILMRPRNSGHVLEASVGKSLGGNPARSSKLVVAPVASSATPMASALQMLDPSYA